MLFKIISKKNYLFDLIEKKEFKDLRNNLIQILKKDENFNYGFGYFYQSLNEIGITGLRNSESRLDQYNIKEYLRNAKVLDIGSNSGFFSILCSKYCSHIDGIEISPILIEISNEVKKKLSKTNIYFHNYNFLNLNENKFYNYDFILSLANHNTYDKKVNNLDLYLDNCNKYLKSDGHILFESHHPNYEEISIFDEMINLFLNKFSYNKIFENFLVNKEIMDRGRKFVLLRKQ